MTHDHGTHAWGHLRADDLERLADGTPIKELERAQDAQRAFTVGVEPPSFRTADEEHEHHGGSRPGAIAPSSGPPRRSGT